MTPVREKFCDGVMAAPAGRPGSVSESPSPLRQSLLLVLVAAFGMVTAMAALVVALV